MREPILSEVTDDFRTSALAPLAHKRLFLYILIFPPHLANFFLNKEKKKSLVARLTAEALSGSGASNSEPLKIICPMMRKINAAGKLATALSGLNCPRMIRAKNAIKPPSILKNTAFGFNRQSNEPITAGANERPKLAMANKVETTSLTKIAISMATNTNKTMATRIISDRSISEISCRARAIKSFAMLEASKYTSVSIVDMTVAKTITMPTPSNHAGKSADRPQKNASFGSISGKWLCAATPISVSANPKITKRSVTKKMEFLAIFAERAEKIRCQISAEAKMKNVPIKRKLTNVVVPAAKIDCEKLTVPISMKNTMPINKPNISIAWSKSVLTTALYPPSSRYAKTTSPAPMTIVGYEILKSGETILPIAMNWSISNPKKVTKTMSAAKILLFGPHLSPKYSERLMKLYWSPKAVILGSASPNNTIPIAMPPQN